MDTIVVISILYCPKSTCPAMFPVVTGTISLFRGCLLFCAAATEASEGFAVVASGDNIPNLKKRCNFSENSVPILSHTATSYQHSVINSGTVICFGRRRPDSGAQLYDSEKLFNFAPDIYEALHLNTLILPGQGRTACATPPGWRRI